MRRNGGSRVPFYVEPGPVDQRKKKKKRPFGKIGTNQVWTAMVEEALSRKIEQPSRRAEKSEAPERGILGHFPMPLRKGADLPSSYSA